MEYFEQRVLEHISKINTSTGVFKRMNTSTIGISNLDKDMPQLPEK
jgi:hypothetical protein